MEDKFEDTSIPYGTYDDTDEVSTGIEIIRVSSRRGTPAIIEFGKSNEYSPDRDAIMLRALLSTSLEEKTWEKLVQDIVLNSPIAHGMIEKLVNNPMLLESIGISVPAPYAHMLTPLKKTEKKKPSKPETTPDE